jgi:hypothetical protein
VSGFANDYVEVAERVSLFFQKYPEGSIQADEAKIVTIGEKAYITVRAYAYRNPEDPRPGVAQAWEAWPGKTSFTRDSEAMNAETSAVGRALGLLGIASKRSIATREDVLRRKADQEADTRTSITPPSSSSTPRHVPDTKEANGPFMNDPFTSITDAQMRMIQRQLAMLNVAKGERSRSYVQDIVKHEIGSLSQLTKLEASKVIEKLTTVIATTEQLTAGDAS